MGKTAERNKAEFPISESKSKGVLYGVLYAYYNIIILHTHSRGGFVSASDTNSHPLAVWKPQIQVKLGFQNLSPEGPESFDSANLLAPHRSLRKRKDAAILYVLPCSNKCWCHRQTLLKSFRNRELPLYRLHVYSASVLIWRTFVAPRVTTVTCHSSNATLLFSNYCF